MTSLNEALLRVHACAINGDEMESLLGHYPPGARLIRDGHYVGEGPAAVRKALLEEHDPESIGKVMLVDGQAALVEWKGPEGFREPRAVVRLATRPDGDLVTEVRIDHSAAVLARLRSEWAIVGRQ